MSLKASSSIAYRKIEKSVGTNTHPCLTPFAITNVSETSSPFLTLTIIPVCRLSIMVVNISGYPYFLSSCHSPVLLCRMPSRNRQRQYTVFLESSQAEDDVHFIDKVLVSLWYIGLFILGKINKST